jgi:7-keto-8-aminopelargonate synthetase-like enzyme
MRDRSHPLELLRQAAAGRAAEGVRRALVPRGPGHDGLLDLASNDYLGLCGDKRLAVTLGESTRAVRAMQTCAAYGVRVGCFRPPSVPPGRACLRLTGRASLTESEFAAAARALAAVGGHDES